MYFICGCLSFWKMVGLEILAHINFLISRMFSPFRYAPHSPFSCGLPNQCLPNFIKMLLLALRQIYTGVIYLWRSIDLDSVEAGESSILTFFFPVSSRAFRDASHTHFRCGDPNQCLSNFLNMLLLALPQIYTRVFQFWKSIDLDSAWVRDSCQYQLCFL